MQLIRLKDVGVAAAVKKSVEVLGQGGIILYPTDTLYGLGVDARNSAAVAALKELKGRETKKPISIIVSDIKHMEECVEMSESARALAEKFLPGPLTLVLKARSSMPADVQLNGQLGVRIPKHEFCQKLAHSYGGPITTTSANIAGLPTKRTVDDIMWHFGPKISALSLVIDAGELPASEPSTVVLCVEEPPRILREGALTKEQLGL